MPVARNRGPHMSLKSIALVAAALAFATPAQAAVNFTFSGGDDIYAFTGTGSYDENAAPYAPFSDDTQAFYRTGINLTVNFMGQTYSYTQSVADGLYGSATISNDTAFGDHIRFSGSKVEGGQTSSSLSVEFLAPLATLSDVGLPTAPQLAASGPALVTIYVRGFGTFDAPASVVASATPVPEPESWALLIGGLGVIGGAARLRRRTRGLAPA